MYQELKIHFCEILAPNYVPGPWFWTIKAIHNFLIYFFSLMVEIIETSSTNTYLLDASDKSCHDHLPGICLGTPMKRYVYPYFNYHDYHSVWQENDYMVDAIIHVICLYDRTVGAGIIVKSAILWAAKGAKRVCKLKRVYKLQKVKHILALTKAPGLAIDGIFWENIIHTLFHFINYSVSSFTYSIFFNFHYLFHYFMIDWLIDWFIIQTYLF